MPRLLILSEYPTVLGGERSMLATLPTVDSGGFEALIAAPPASPLAREIGDAPAQHIPWQTHDAAGLRLPLETLRAELRRVIDQVRPAIVHANSLSTSRIAGPVVRALGIRSIGHLRDIIRLNAQAIDDINQHDCIVAVSAATRDFHVAQGLDAAKSRVLYNGVDLARFQPRPATGYLHKELKIPAETRLIATIGQLGLRKAVDVALTAAAQVARQLRDVHWLIVGQRTSTKAESLEYEQALHERAAQPPLLGRVHFLGQRSDIAQLLPECTALVHTAHQEPLGRILLESAACGLPVIATEVGGTPEIFPAGNDSALLVPPNDADAVAAATVRVLNDEDLRQHLGKNARRRTENAFNIQNSAQRLLETYLELVT